LPPGKGLLHGEQPDLVSLGVVRVEQRRPGLTAQHRGEFPP